MASSSEQESSIPVEQPCDRSTDGTCFLRSFLSFPRFTLAFEATSIVVVVWRTCDEGHHGERCCCVWVVLVCVAVCGRHPVTSPERSSFPSYRDEWSPDHRAEQPCIM